VTALIVIEDAVAATLTDAKSSLHQDPQVTASVDAAITAANQELSRVEQIKRYRILDAEWLPGGDELSPTMKLKRRQINEKYQGLIEEMYRSD
jgi:long-subunit acyl-CoA synthetase (AMP-forming)